MTFVTLHMVDDAVDVDVNSGRLAPTDHVDKLFSCPRPWEPYE